MAQIPILKIGDILVASVQEDLRDRDVVEFQERLNALLEKSSARGVLLDVSVLESVDSFLGRALSDTARGARLLGAQTVIVGIQPAVAITLVELGLKWDAIPTALNAERGLRLLDRLLSSEVTSIAAARKRDGLRATRRVRAS